MPIAPIDPDIVNAQIDSAHRCTVQVFSSLPSTNAWLMDQIEQLPSPSVCVAETQTAGRGRRGKQWQSPVNGVTFSVLRQFGCVASKLSGLSLVAGCAIASVLEDYGVENLTLKWPNDVLHAQQKLCGLLIEIPQIKNNGTHTVTGIGINYQGVGSAGNIDQPYTDLASILGKRLPLRAELIGRLGNALLENYSQYERLGFSAFRSQWEKRDAYFGKQIVLSCANDKRITGIARGVAENGALQIETGNGLREFYSGEVSVRLTQ